MLKILLVGNFSADAQFSMQGFVYALSQRLPLHTDITVEAIAPKPILSRHVKNAHSGLGKWLGYIDKYLLFPPRLRRAARAVDLVHICDQGNGIYVSQLGNRTPVLLTCHDLFAVRAGKGDPQTWTLSRTGKVYQSLIWRGVRRARNIACVSEATRIDLLRLLATDEATSAPPPQSRRITCILNGLYKPYARLGEVESHEVLRQQCNMEPGTPFLLHVGGNQLYKNRLGLLQIYAAMLREDPTTPYLILAGKPFAAEMRRFVAENNLEDHVVERTGLSDVALRALYSQATALIFPSTMEGFGLPILEAQACGCPVFTTGHASMTEAGGNAAVYIDPQDIEGAARIISHTLHNTDKLTKMAEAGLANVAAHFTAERMVVEYINLYRCILTNNGDT